LTAKTPIRKIKKRNEDREQNDRNEVKMKDKKLMASRNKELNYTLQ